MSTPKRHVIRSSFNRSRTDRAGQETPVLVRDRTITIRTHRARRIRLSPKIRKTMKASRRICQRMATRNSQSQSNE